MSAAEPVSAYVFLAITYLPVERSVSEITLAVCATLDKPPKAQKCNKHLPADIPGIVLQHGAGGDLQRTDDPGLYSGANGHICCADPCQNRKQNDITTYFRQYHKRMQNALIQNRDISGIWFFLFPAGKLC